MGFAEGFASTVKEIPEWRRAGGDCICSICSKDYWHHPYAKDYPINESFWLYPNRPEYILRLLCNGDIVKL